MNVIDCSTNMKEFEIYNKDDIYVILLVKIGQYRHNRSGSNTAASTV